MATVAEVTAKLEAADAAANAEPAPDHAPGAPPPEGASSGVGSASADVGADGATSPSASPEATLSDQIAAKLEIERDRRATKAERRRARVEREQLQKAREQADADKAAAAAEKEKWANAGKTKPFRELLQEVGRDPLEAWNEMREEALKAGTPEAKIEALDKAYAARLEALEKALEAERNGRAEERKQISAAREHRAFVADFNSHVSGEPYAGLREEYEPEQLFSVVESLKSNPPYLVKQARSLGVDLTRDDGTFTMTDILNVMAATQARHIAKKEQRRTQGAAPQTRPAGLQQLAAVAKPTVNGAAARPAGSTIGNDLAATRATEAEQLKGMTHEQRSRYLQRKYGG